MVTFDDQPVEEGSVAIIPQGSGQTASANIVGGKYAIGNAPKGPVKVTVNVIVPTGEMDTSYSQPIPKKENRTPQKYKDGVAMEISGDNPSLNFALKSNEP